MIIGVNTSHKSNDKDYHIQIEDLGDPKNSLEARIYCQGSIIWQKRLPYKDGILNLATANERSTAIREQMNKLVATVKAGIDQGKIK